MAAARKKSGGQGGSNAVSFNPETFVSAGLADDFDGEIVEVRYVPFDYDGKLDHHILAARVTIQPDEESGFDEFTQHYSAGDLAFFAPSKDGDDPVDLNNDEGEDLEGTFVVKVGRREALANSSNWGQFCIALMEAGLPGSAMLNDVSILEGLRAHWNRIPQAKRSGVGVAQPGERPKEILVITEVLEIPGQSAGKRKSASKGRGKAASKANGSTTTAAASVSDNGSLDDQLSELVVTALADSEGELPKSKLASLAMQAFDGKEKAQAIKRVTSQEFLAAGESWEFDADEGVLYLS